MPKMNFEVSDREGEIIRLVANHLGLSLSDLFRKSVVLAAPLLNGLPYVRRVELEDIANLPTNRQ
jgi:hypothetical protein